MLALSALWLLGCDDGTRTYRVHGIVHDVQVEKGQVLIEHDDIDGLMPAMTMSFSVPDRDVVSTLRSGQVIDFDLRFDGHSYEVVSVDVVGQGDESDGWVRFGDALVLSDPAPAFDLTNQTGERVTSESLAGRPLLVDFIFTQCPGPCPILTSTHVAVQRALPDDVRSAVQLVSISLDPANDTPEAMTAYGLARGVAFDNWSFLTGPKDRLDSLLGAYGVGRTRGEDGQIEHTVITFLIDHQGRIVKRYLGLQHDPSEIAQDITKLARQGD